MLQKFLVAAAILALFAGSASAQSPGPSGSAPSSLGIPFNSKTPLTQEEIDRRKANDRAYDAALQKIPDKKPPVDPWGNVRPSTPATSKNKQENKAN